MNPEPQLGLLAKWPAPGGVKTRLSPPLEPAAAARLHTAFVADLMSTLDRVRARRVLFLDRIEGSLATLGWPHWPIERQAEGDLGKRLQAAADTLFRTGAPCLLIGSDHPSAPAALVERALELLTRADVVLGPTMDGGYYLIGLRAPCSELFDAMPWSRPSLLARTIDRAVELRLRIGALPPWYDVDTGADLSMLHQHLRLLRCAGERSCPRTLALLDALVHNDPG